MALRQPSMDNLAAGLQMVSQELVVFQNIPAVADGQRLHEAIQGLERRMNDRFDEVLHRLQQQQEQLTRQQEQLMRQQEQLTMQQRQLQQLQEGVNVVREELDLQPMRLRNSSASFMGTYWGPNGPIPDDYPNNRDALIVATAHQCIALSQYLELPPLLNNVTVQQRKGQISKFLGIPKLTP